MRTIDMKHRPFAEWITSKTEATGYFDTLEQLQTTDQPGDCVAGQIEFRDCIKYKWVKHFLTLK